MTRRALSRGRADAAWRVALRAAVAAHGALIVAAVLLLGIVGSGAAYAYWTARATATAPPPLQSGNLDLCVKAFTTPYGGSGEVVAQGTGSGFSFSLNPPSGLFPGMSTAQAIVLSNCGTAAFTVDPIDLRVSVDAENQPYLTAGLYWNNYFSSSSAPWTNSYCGATGTQPAYPAVAGPDGRYPLPTNPLPPLGPTDDALPDDLILEPTEWVALCVQVGMADNAPDAMQGDQMQLSITVSATSVNPNPDP